MVFQDNIWFSTYRMTVRYPNTDNEDSDSDIHERTWIHD